MMFIWNKTGLLSRAWPVSASLTTAEAEWLSGSGSMRCGAGDVLSRSPFGPGTVFLCLLRFNAPDFWRVSLRVTVTECVEFEMMLWGAGT